MPDQMLSPKRIAAEAFTDAAAAVARVAEIYERNVGFLRTSFEAYVGGKPLNRPVRATNPFVRITTGTHARLDSRLKLPVANGWPLALLPLEHAEMLGKQLLQAVTFAKRAMATPDVMPGYTTDPDEADQID